MKQQICAGGFITDNSQFLFGKRSHLKKWAPGLWDIPGGKAFKNEDPLFTLRRELAEETGIIVNNAELIKTVDVPDGNETFIYYIYMVTAYEGAPANLTKEHTELRWFTRKDLDGIELALPLYNELIDAWMINFK